MLAPNIASLRFFAPCSFHSIILASFFISFLQLDHLDGHQSITLAIRLDFLLKFDCSRFGYYVYICSIIPNKHALNLVTPWYISRCWVVLNTPYQQGCTRPRPSPSWRPSTRYNGVSEPPRGGGFDCRISTRGGGFDCRVFRFSGAKRPRRRRRRRFRKFWRFFENFTKLRLTILSFFVI